MKFLYAILLVAAFVAGCSPSEMEQKYPVGSQVEHKLCVYGTIAYHDINGVVVKYVDSIGVIHTDRWLYSEIKE